MFTEFEEDKMLTDQEFHGLVWELHNNQITKSVTSSIDASYIGYRVSLVQVSPSHIEHFTDIRVYALLWKLHTSHATTLMMAVVLLSCGLS